MRWLIVGIAGLMLVSGCGSADQEDTESGESSVRTDSWELSGGFDEEEYLWEFDLTNTSGDPLDLVFNSGQEISVLIHKNGETEPVYNYAEEKLFTQAIKEITIGDGNIRKWEEEVDFDLLEPGEYTLSFELLVSEINGEPPEQPVELEDSFIIE
ncbi:BsuPI-related putative proteinase inhibitor [Sinobaca sp. H24]|uniref:BsuPI-related putative proteinase inhibitor n=1 Tax=Sinobaca sp. H24 TaxID=2923376 RepID=UPI00207A915F|nr:BsuPI-related putative proteinase inhibitor [Sinobaca sp. H24]